MFGTLVVWVSLALEKVLNMECVSFNLGREQHFDNFNGWHKMLIASLRNFLPVNPYNKTLIDEFRVIKTFPM